MGITPDGKGRNAIRGVRDQAFHRRETSLGVLKGFGSGRGGWMDTRREIIIERTGCEPKSLKNIPVPCQDPPGGEPRIQPEQPFSSGMGSVIGTRM
jgi:hypothetical protein